MARLNEILAGRFGRGLQKLFQIKGPVPVATLAPEIMPVHGLFSGAEHRYLEGWGRFAISTPIGGTVGNVNGIRFRNPLTSGVVAVFEKLLLINQSAGAESWNISFGASGTDLASIGIITSTRLDPRGNPQPGLIFSFTAAAAITGLTNVLGPLTVAANAQFEFIVTDIQEISLLPGDALQAATLTVNAGTAVILIWRERPLEDSEKT